MANDIPCRVSVQQPAFRKYRIPFFREWSGREGIALSLYYGRLGSEMPDRGVEGISACYMPAKTVGIGPLRFPWQPAQWRNAKRDACDVLVLSWNVQYISIVPSLLRARMNGIRTILWGHGFSKTETRSRKLLRDAVGRLADALVFYDHETAARFRREGWPDGKIHVAPNSLDQVEIQAARGHWLDDPGKLAAFQREKGLAARENIIYIGRIYWENRLDLLIEALPAILRERPHVQLLVIGGENEESAKLKDLAQRLGVASAVRWLGAIYEEMEIAPYMLSSRLFCYPANIGLSIMHAMGYGLPVVTGDQLSSHNPEIHVMRDGENGRMFKHLDEGDLAKTMAGMLADPEHAAQLGMAARERVLAEFNTQKMVDGFMAAVNAVWRKGRE